MIRLRLSLALSYEVNEPGSDFIFNIHAAHTSRQTVVDESLVVNQQVPLTVAADPTTGNRYLQISHRRDPKAGQFRPGFRPIESVR